MFTRFIIRIKPGIINDNSDAVWHYNKNFNTTEQSGSLTEAYKAYKACKEQPPLFIALHTRMAPEISVTISEAQKKKIHQALPYLVEEKIASNVEDLHFIVKQIQGDICRVNYIEKTVLEDVINTLKKHNISPDWLGAESQLISASEFDNAVIVDDDFAYMERANTVRVVPTSMLSYLIKPTAQLSNNAIERDNDMTDVAQNPEEVFTVPPVLHLGTQATENSEMAHSMAELTTNHEEGQAERLVEKPVKSQEESAAETLADDIIAPEERDDEGDQSAEEEDAPIDTLYVTAKTPQTISGALSEWAEEIPLIIKTLPYFTARLATEEASLVTSGNLLTQSYDHVKRKRGGGIAWLSLAAILGVLWLGFTSLNLIEGWRYAQLNTQAMGAQKDLYRSLFPSAKVKSGFKVKMKSKVRELGTAASDDFTPAFADLFATTSAIIASYQNDSRVSLQQFKFNENKQRLDIAIVANSLDEIDALKNTLIAQGLDVNMGSVVNTDKGSKVIIALTRTTPKVTKNSGQQKQEKK